MKGSNWIAVVVLLTVAGCGTSHTATVARARQTAASSGPGALGDPDGAHIRTASLPTIKTPEPAHEISARLRRAIEGGGIHIRDAGPSDTHEATWEDIYRQAHAKNRYLAQAIGLVRLTNDNFGQTRPDGSIQRELDNRLVWLVVARDPKPFISGPVIDNQPRPYPYAIRDCGSCFIWIADDANTGRQIFAETFGMIDPTSHPVSHRSPSTS